MRMIQFGERCRHGLYCACYLCGFEKEIETLRAENELLKRNLIDRRASPDSIIASRIKALKLL